MKRIFIFAVAIFMTFPFVNAEVIFTENFDANNGILIDSLPGWRTEYDTPSNISVTNSLTFDGYSMSKEEGGAALLDQESAQVLRPFNAVDSGTIYVAFMLFPNNNYKSSYFLCLNSAVGTWNYRGRVCISEDYKLGLRFGKQTSAVYDTLGNYDLSATSTSLIVLKYKIVPGADNDEVSLYAFSSMPSSEPETPLVGPLTSSADTDINPEVLCLRSYDHNGWLSVDGIRVATTWNEAVLGVVTSINEIPCDNDVRKVMQNGQIVIIRNSQTYNLIGVSL